MLESAAGEAPKQASGQRSVKKTMDLELHNRTSKYREHSQKLQSSEKMTDEETSGRIVHQTLNKGTHPGDSENREHSQNSLLNGKPKVDTGDVNVLFSVRDGQCLTTASKFREVSSNSRVESECPQGTHNKQSTKSVCISKPSEFSWDSLGGVGSNVSVPKFSWFKSMSQIFGLTAAWQQNKVEGNPMGANTAGSAKTNSNPVHTEFNFFL